MASRRSDQLAVMMVPTCSPASARVQVAAHETVEDLWGGVNQRAVRDRCGAVLVYRRSTPGPTPVATITSVDLMITMTGSPGARSKSVEASLVMAAVSG